MDILDLLNIINLAVKVSEDHFPMLLLCIKMAKLQCLGPKCLNCAENPLFEQPMCEQKCDFQEIFLAEKICVNEENISSYI